MLVACIRSIVVRGYLFTMLYECIMGKCVFGTITNPATRDNIIQFISAIIVNTIKAIIDAMSRFNSVIVFEFLIRRGTTIITILFNQLTKLIFTKSESMSSFVISKKRIKCRYAIRQFFEIISITPTAFRMPVFQMNSASNCRASALTYTLPHSRASAVCSALQHFQHSKLFVREINKRGHKGIITC